MQTTQKWHERAEFNMSQALQSHDAAARQCDNSRKAHEETVNDNHDLYGDLNNSLEQKVANSRNLVENLKQREACLEESLYLTRQSLANLDAALRAKEPPLQLCLWRTEQRQRRPTREQVRDVVEVALEEEKTALVSTQWELGDAVERTKAAIADLEARLAEVRHDMDHKAHALGIDEVCLATAQSSFAAMNKRTPRPIPVNGPIGTKRVTDRFSYVESGNNEDVRQQRTGLLDRHAAGREGAAAQLRDENARLIAKCEETARRARAKTDRCTQERLDENSQMRARLEREIQETDAKIDQTNQTLSETRYHMGALQEPMTMATNCASWRTGRTAREHISDPAHAALQEHHDAVLRAHEELGGQHAAEKASLQRLWDRRRQLAEDLKDKSHAQQIDGRCLSHGFAAPRATPRGRDLEFAVDPSLFPAPALGRGSAMNAMGGTVDFLGATAAPAGATKPLFLSSWKLARSSQATPRSGSATPFRGSTRGSAGTAPMTARATRTY